MSIDARIRTELLTRFPTKTEAISRYVRFLLSAPVPTGGKFHGHHMLPRIWFPQYADSRLHPWNIRLLVVRDHRRAHRLINKIDFLGNKGRRYADASLKRTTMWLDETHLRFLEALGKKMGGLKPAQMIRIAVQEYVDKKAEARK